MQPHDMGGIDATFQRLPVVALLMEQSIGVLIIGNPGEFEIGQRRQLLGRTHKGPDDSAMLEAGISRVVNVIRELLLQGYVGHFDTPSASSSIPTMVRAPDTVVLNAAKKKRRKPMRTIRTDQSQIPTSSAKNHQVLAQ